MRFLLLCLGAFFLLAQPDPAMAVAVDEEKLEDPAQEARAREIMKEIRCLVCQNQSIEDSEAGLAKDLRKIVRERVAAGDTEGEIKAFLVARYGDWVLLKPPVKPKTILLWLIPLLLLGAGGVLAFFKFRKTAAASQKTDRDKPLSKKEKAELKNLMNPGGKK